MTLVEPIFISGGKRLNFDRRVLDGEGLKKEFSGYGKDEGCYPSGTWEELCALATLIVNHPAYRPVTRLTGPYQPEAKEEQ